MNKVLHAAQQTQALRSCRAIVVKAALAVTLLALVGLGSAATVSALQPAAATSGHTQLADGPGPQVPCPGLPYHC